MSAPLPAELSRVDPRLAWEAWLPDAQQRFTTKWAAHLLRRAGFGAGPDEIARAVKDGHSTTLDRLLAIGPDAAFEDLLAEIGAEFARDPSLVKLRRWWLYAMLNSGCPLRERFVLFWHNHFATSNDKVQSPQLMFRQNLLIRQHALGSFRPFLKEMGREPAMLVWLDSNQNVKAHPNENYAREVMELFSLGVGNYTEKDVREAARAFTGCHVDLSSGRFVFDEERHDDGRKTVLGETGRWKGDDVVRIILEQPAAANFLVGKIYRELISETEPPQLLLAPLAEQFRRSDYDIADLVKTMLRSRLFFSEHAYLKRIKSPIEFTLGAIKAAWTGPIRPDLPESHLASMGQSLFAPPNVKGWRGGKHWLNDATLIARNNFAEFIAIGIGNGLRQLDPNVARGVAVPPVARDGQPAQAVDAPEPPENFDVSLHARRKKSSAPAEIVQSLAEQFFPGGLNPSASAKLQAFVAEGNPKGKAFDRRIREAAHAMMCMPEYQLC